MGGDPVGIESHELAGCGQREHRQGNAGAGTDSHVEVISAEEAPGPEGGARRADQIIIDGPPRIAALARSALLAADLVLIPVQPSPYDVWASAEMVSLIREAQVFRPALRAAFVVNRRVGATVIGREARRASSKSAPAQT